MPPPEQHIVCSAPSDAIFLQSIHNKCHLHQSDHWRDVVIVHPHLDLYGVNEGLLFQFASMQFTSFDQPSLGVVQLWRVSLYSECSCYILRSS